MEIKHENILDINGDGCISVKKQKYTELNGQRTETGQPDRRAFCPGEFEELREYAPELEHQARAIWTPEVIAAWKQKQAESEPI